MIILYVILGIVVLFLVAGLFMKKDFNYEKSVSINAGRRKSLAACS